MTTTPRTPTQLTARNPEDLLAVVPVVLGFVPRDSVVMLTFGAERTFHARVDRPADDGDVPEVVAALLDPARRHRVPRVVFILYAAQAALVRPVARALVDSFTGAGIEVFDVLHADGRRWFPLLRGRPGVPDAGVSYDVTAHPFAVQSVLDGRVTHPSREALAASLRTVPEGAHAVSAAVRGLPARGRQTAGMEAWARSLVRGHASEGSFPDDEDAARLLTALLGLTVRDAVLALMTRDDASAHVALWTDLVRRCPEPLLAPPAALLAFAAWLAGHGALAWCAIDRCLERDPDYQLAAHLARALIHAVPPEVWDSDWSDRRGEDWGEEACDVL